jgi:hypothetical protein
MGTAGVPYRRAAPVRVGRKAAHACPASLCSYYRERYRYHNVFGYIASSSGLRGELA